jgi:energy-coupling factor transporter ATP-binding protein EcfA2
MEHKMLSRKTQVPETVDPLISQIEVEKLFHTYTYNLAVTPVIGHESGRLILLYGSNGSGKTTILNLIYHLLHPEPYGGHRSFVGTIPFKKFRVHLFDGTIVTASRSRKYEPGSYKVHVKQPGENVELIWTWRPGQSRRQQGDEPDYMHFCAILKKLGLSFHFLRDTRRVEGSRISEQQAIIRHIGNVPPDLIEEIGEGQELLLPEKQLTTSVDKAIQWFRQRALAATNIGYTSVNVIYRDIIKRIVKTGGSSEKTPSITTEQLVSALMELKERNSMFARFGLTPELELGEIVSALKAAKPEQLGMLNTLLGPYLEGQAARLQALDELQRVMASFVSLLCEFYSHKSVSVDLAHGLQIHADTGQVLEPTLLSSGEKQLLLLFCNAISSRHDKTVLMIDEPEISLNVRWQRELIPALLTCMSGTGFQLILATHSVELLAQYRDCVTPLDNLQEVKSSD